MATMLALLLLGLATGASSQAASNRSSNSSSSYINATASTARSPSPSPPSPTPIRAEQQAAADLSAFNFVLGTQQVGPNYSFNMSVSVLLETAQVIREMGSNFIKLRLDVTKYARTQYVVNGVDFSSPSTSLATVASQHPDFVKVFSDPQFMYYHLWCYPTAAPIQTYFNNPAALDKEYQEIYDLAKYFLTQYAGTGKVFMLGNWEGDWHLLSKPNFELKDPNGPAGMINWVNTRQQAVDDAKRDVQSTGVEVYYYLEMNKPSLVLTRGPDAPCILTRVLPYVNPDFISYSCYEAQKLDQRPWFGFLRQVLTLLESRIQPKQLTNRLGRPQWWGSRLFLGEYGFFTGPLASGSLFPDDAAARTIAMAKLVMEFRLPFMLFWQVYNNEITAQGDQRGYWLIDNNNVKQPNYHVHQLFYQQARAWVVQYQREHYGQLPGVDAFADQAQGWLDQLVGQLGLGQWYEWGQTPTDPPAR